MPIPLLTSLALPPYFRLQEFFTLSLLYSSPYKARLVAALMQPNHLYNRRFSTLQRVWDYFRDWLSFFSWSIRATLFGERKV